MLPKSIRTFYLGFSNLLIIALNQPLLNYIPKNVQIIICLKNTDLLGDHELQNNFAAKYIIDC